MAVGERRQRPSSADRPAGVLPVVPSPNSPAPPRCRPRPDRAADRARLPPAPVARACGDPAGRRGVRDPGFGLEDEQARVRQGRVQGARRRRPADDVRRRRGPGARAGARDDRGEQRERLVGPLQRRRAGLVRGLRRPGGLGLPYLQLRAAVRARAAADRGLRPCRRQRGGGRTDLPSSERAGVEKRLEVRMRRQRVLHRKDAPTFWVVLDEAVLHRPVGGHAVRRGQLEHLLELAALPNVIIQLLPWDLSGYGAEHAFSMLRFAEAELPDLVYLEEMTGASYLDKRADVERYGRAMDRLTVDALSPEQTKQALSKVLAEA
ncbi:putative DNA-binding protein in cluster with Type I restriction-modification system [Pseudonocardia sp. Ae150A_Ps1]|nr:putative DNA-binding protein in cluster with Type I restriction-modification system [Pseudonocardia sp. Ae150A_Ps1]